MKDTRKTRQVIAVLLTAGIGAVIGDLYVRPLLDRQLGVKR